MWQEFKPTILFLIKFFGVYFLLSWLYGLYINSYDVRQPAELDPITREVTSHCTKTATIFGFKTSIVEDDHYNYSSNPEQTYDSVWLDGKYAISVEEGCNGINIMILFLSFIIGFGGKLINSLIFIPLGVGFIYLANLARLLLLSVANVNWSAEAFHFFHKYAFTAIIYAAVFILWYLWVMKFSGKSVKLKKKSGN